MKIFKSTAYSRFLIAINSLGWIGPIRLALVFFRSIYISAFTALWYISLWVKAQINQTSITAPNGFGILFMTSYPARFGSCSIALDQISRGSVKPKRAILILTKEETKRYNTQLPSVIRRLQGRGIEVIFLEKNYRVFNKLPVFLEHDYIAELNLTTPIDIDPIITFDDDKLPPFFVLELFKKAYCDDKNTVLNFVVEDMRFERNGEQMKVCLSKAKDSRRKMMALTNGVGAVLYPITALKSIRKRGLDFLKCTPTNDDVWFRLCNIADGIYCRQVLPNSVRFRQIPFTHHLGIWTINFSQDENGAILNNKFLISTFKHLGLTKFSD